MTFKKWLKKIALFPLSIIMAVPDGDSEFSAEALSAIAGPDEGPSLNERIMAFAGDPNAQFMPVGKPDAAASKADADDADHQGNPGEDDDKGLDTPSDEDDQDADSDEDVNADDSTNQETDESGERKGTRKRTLDERAAEIAEKIVNEKIAALTATTKAEKPDFVVIDQEKVDAYIASIEEKIDELRMEGKNGEARKLSRQLDQLDADLEANEQKREAFLQRQNQKEKTSDDVKAHQKELDDTAELFRQEMKIEPAVWNKMGEWFDAEGKTKPLLVKEFQDIYERQGSVAAIRFAHDYTVKSMGQKTKQANQQKEQHKNTAARLTASTTGKIGPIDMRKAKAEFDANPTPEAFQKYQNIKRMAGAK